MATLRISGFGMDFVEILNEMNKPSHFIATTKVDYFYNALKLFKREEMNRNTIWFKFRKLQEIHQPAKWPKNIAQWTFSSVNHNTQMYRLDWRAKKVSKSTLKTMSNSNGNSYRGYRGQSIEEANAPIHKCTGWIENSHPFLNLYFCVK